MRIAWPALVVVTILSACSAPTPEASPSIESTAQGSEPTPASVRAEDPCTAPLPTQEGAEFAGLVRHIIDGDSICVGPADGDGPTWIEVRLMDFDAPEANQAGGSEAEAILSRLIANREARCIVTRSTRSGATRSFDRTHAICSVGGVTIGDLMRRAGANEGGN